MSLFDRPLAGVSELVLPGRVENFRNGATLEGAGKVGGGRSRDAADVGEREGRGRRIQVVYIHPEIVYLHSRSVCVARVRVPEGDAFAW